MNRIGTIAWLAATVALAACHPHEKPKIYSSVDAAKEVCEVNALAEEHKSYTSKVRSIEDRRPSTYETDERWTILMEKLRHYRAEIDGAYRFVTTNCRNYNLCMQAHSYNEQDCIGSRVAWMDSHEKYNNLAVELAQLDVPPPPPSKPDHHKKKKHCTSDCPPPCHATNCYPSGPCHVTNCNVQGSVFTTGCCNDGYDGD